ncbi:hypothetical protein F4818DRAFT_436467 [Hypoxylon cercidicola]|nr:hypothetical protein F4818DRAFT_436467 [Hypoxylon cercidicola]
MNFKQETPPTPPMSSIPVAPTFLSEKERERLTQAAIRRGAEYRAAVEADLKKDPDSDSGRPDRIEPILRSVLDSLEYIAPQVQAMRVEQGMMRKRLDVIEDRIIEYRNHFDRLDGVVESEDEIDPAEYSSANSDNDTYEEPLGVTELQEKFYDIESVVTAVAEMLWDQNRRRARYQQIIVEAEQHGTARHLCQWFREFPDLVTLLHTDSDEDVIKAIIWRFLLRHIFAIEFHSKYDTRRSPNPKDLTRQLMEVLQVLMRPDDKLDLASAIEMEIMRPACDLEKRLYVSFLKYIFRLHCFEETKGYVASSVRDLYLDAERVVCQDLLHNFSRFNLSQRVDEHEKKPRSSFPTVYRSLVSIVWGTQDEVNNYQAERLNGVKSFLFQLREANQNWEYRVMGH